MQRSTGIVALGKPTGDVAVEAHAVALLSGSRSCMEDLFKFKYIQTFRLWRAIQTCRRCLRMSQKCQKRTLTRSGPVTN
jgi:hypothetical protein